MAGKAYTMREMRAIVEYLSERKAYGELKGRKMWTEFANSDKTTRTWQSLKETFLKRILPDIHNPYYRLTMDQVRSFQQGIDVAEKEKNNRLEFRVAGGNLDGEDQNGISVVTKDNQVPATSKNENPTTVNTTNDPPSTSIDEELERVTGEDIKAAKIPSRCRSSAETLVLEYENAEDVQRVLESPKNVKEAKSKSLKDMLTFEFCAPLTPLVKDLLDDFETESEASDAEPRVKIEEKSPKLNHTESEAMVENVLAIKTGNAPSENNTINTEADSIIEINDSDNSDHTEVKGKNTETSVAEETSNVDLIQAKSDNPQTLNSQSNNNDHTNNNDIGIHSNSDQNSKQDDCATNTGSNPIDIAVVETVVSNAKAFEKSSDTDKKNTDCNTVIPNTGNSTQNTTSDTLLPNNQEALNDSKKDSQQEKLDKAEEVIDKEKSSKNMLGKNLSTRSSRKSKKQKLSDVESKEIDNCDVIETIRSPSPSHPEKNSANVLEKTSVNARTPINEISSETTTNNTEDHLIDVPAKENSENVIRPSTDTEKDIPSTKINQDENTTVAEFKNPCLLSVSLFEEQFKNIKYSDSDPDEATQQKQNAEKPQVVTKKLKEVEGIPQKTKDKKETEVGMKKEIAVTIFNDVKEVDGNLDSSANCDTLNQRVVNNNKINPTIQRESALANLFGFAHGHVAPTSRKRKLSHRRRSHHYRRRHSNQMDSNSSEWTSESDSESYVSPPRGRKNRQTKRYLKPKSSRIRQEPEEETLYVVFGKNIYPLVKDGKHIKSFLTYRSDSGSDEDESFWKQKYIEEKKRVEKVKKLLQETQKAIPTQIDESVPTTSRNSTNILSPQNTTVNRNGQGLDNRIDNPDDRMVLKVAKKNGLTYCLEGGWNQICSAMPQVIQMMKFQNPTGNKNVKPTSKIENQPKTEIEMEISSGTSTPAPATRDTEVHEKVNKLESEIFNEIKNLEVQDMEEEAQHIEKDSSNVTKRKPNRASKESLPAAAKGPAKRTRSSKTNSTDANQNEPKTKRISKLKTPNSNQEKEKPITETTEQQTVTQQKELTPEPAKKDTKKQKDIEKKVSVKKSSLRLSKQRETIDRDAKLDENAALHSRISQRLSRTPKKYDANSSASDIKLRTSPSKDPSGSDDENARYMFPPGKTFKKPTANKKSLPEINIIPPQELGNSVDNSYGYEDSDPILMKMYLPKRKRKVSFTARNTYKNRRLRRTSCPLMEQLSSDSNDSAYFIPLRRSLSSLDSEIYRSNSFQMLMPKKNVSSKKLESIDENNSDLAEYDPDIRHFNSVSKDSNKLSENSDMVLVLEMASSSNVSLPLSPELSVVENMSISREMIKDVHAPTINEAQQNVNDQPMDYSEYLISNLDVSVPLMDQRCNLRKSCDEVNSEQIASKCDSMPVKDCTVDLTMSETLDRRLRDLLLESTKKPTQEKNKQTPMEVDQTVVTPKKPRARKQKENMAMDVDKSKVTIKKTRANKRSSTPQKKKTVPKAKALQDAIIEEERVESCSAGRKSCPPVMTFMAIDENANNSSDVLLLTKVPAKKKKDIIKVKIQKPRDKSRSKENLRGKSVGDGSVASTYTDSGINDTETISLVLKDSSVDLIHNHSETCLLANECIGDNSVEIVQNSPVSIISLNSSRQSDDSSFYKVLNNAVSLSEDTSVNQEYIASEARTSDKVFESPPTVYHSPYGSISSLITEDLSNSPPSQPTKWYLLDEDVTNPESASNVNSFGSNLNHIFPIACAVPNLSTISEMSKENEDSRKNSI